MAQAATLLEELAATDPTVASLARLQAAALGAAGDPGWAAGVAELDGRRLDEAAPLLHGASLAVDVALLRGLWGELASRLAAAGNADAERFGALFESQELDPLTLVQASVTHDAARLESLAVGAGVDPDVLSILAQMAALPLLLACGQRAAEALRGASWPNGYCPVCAAWPTLGEVRGLDRELVLRCGRCASGWRFEHLHCAFCGSRDHRAQRYFAAERERESRRVVTCDSCRGYLKTQATLGPLDPAGLLLRDLESLELDVTAVEHGYARPDRPGWEVAVRLEPGRRAAVGR